MNVTVENLGPCDCCSGSGSGPCGYCICGTMPTSDITYPYNCYACLEILSVATEVQSCMGVTVGTTILLTAGTLVGQFYGSCVTTGTVESGTYTLLYAILNDYDTCNTTCCSRSTTDPACTSNVGFQRWVAGVMTECFVFSWNTTNTSLYSACTCSGSAQTYTLKALVSCVGDPDPWKWLCDNCGTRICVGDDLYTEMQVKITPIVSGVPSCTGCAGSGSGSGCSYICCLAAGDSAVLVIPDGALARTYSSTWVASGGFLKLDLGPAGTIYAYPDGTIVNEGGEPPVSVDCGPPVVITWTASAFWGSTGDSVLTT